MIQFLNELKKLAFALKSFVLKHRKTVIYASLASVLIALIVLTIALTSTKNDAIYVASDKNEIEANIERYVSRPGEEFDTVNEYLRAFGLPIYDSAKFVYLETRFNVYYNYEDGISSIEEHAEKTAELFLENYYNDLKKTQIKEITDGLLYCYVAALEDPYSVYRPPVEAEDYTEYMGGYFGGIGVVIEYNDDEETICVSTVYIDSPAEKAGIEVGDYIYAIDGVTIEEIGYRNAVYHIRGDIGTDVEITLLRGDKLVTVVCTRDKVEEISVASDIDKETGYGYVQLVSFKDNTLEQFKDALDKLTEQNVPGIIFDLRGNPGGYLRSVCDVISYLIPSGNVIVSYQYKGTPKNELISEDDGIDESGRPYDNTLNIPIVVICDEYTASAGEIFTSAVRDFRDMGLLNATIVGTNTYGKGIMQNTYAYVDGSSVTFTVAYYNPPSGVNYHEVGVAPDVHVELPEPKEDPETGLLYIDEDTQYKAATLELEKLINAK